MHVRTPRDGGRGKAEQNQVSEFHLVQLVNTCPRQGGGGVGESDRGSCLTGGGGGGICLT